MRGRPGIFECVFLLTTFDVFAPARAAVGAERVVFCDSVSDQVCSPTTGKLGASPTGEWWQVVDDNALRRAAQPGRPVPLVIYPSASDYEDAVAGLSEKEKQRAILRRVTVVREQMSDGLPDLLVGMVSDDLHAVVVAAGVPDEDKVEGALAIGLLLWGGPGRFARQSAHEIAVINLESLAKVQCELGEAPAKGTYAKEALILASAAADDRHPFNAAPFHDSSERVYYAPHVRMHREKTPLDTDRPWYSWRGGTVLTMRPDQAGDPTWRGADLRLMYFDRWAFASDLNELTPAQLDRRLALRLNGPAATELQALIVRLAFDHAVSVRGGAAAVRVNAPGAMEKWKQAVDLATSALRMVASNPSRAHGEVLSRISRLSEDVALTRDLAHAAAPKSVTAALFDQIQAALAHDVGPSDAGQPGVPAKPATEAEQRERYGSEWIGLSSKELEARHGRPTDKRSDRWIYVPHTSGCADRIMIEVFTFKNGRVAAVQPQSRQTGKVCTDPK